LAEVSRSRPGFCNIGLTIADLKASGTMSLANEELMATVIAVQIETVIVHKKAQGRVRL